MTAALDIPFYLTGRRYPSKDYKREYVLSRNKGGDRVMVDQIKGGCSI